MTPQAEAEVQRNGSRVTVALHGEVDLLSVPGLEDEVLTAATPPLDAVVVDLDGCAFLDSAGVALVAALWQQARDAGATFRLIRPRRNLRVVLAVAGMLDLVDDADATAGG